MQLKLAIVFVVIFGSQTRLSWSAVNTMNLHLCMNSNTVAVQILTGLNGTTCQCQAGPSIDPFIREDYTFTPGIGWHKLHTTAKSWNEARKICRDESAQLAVINSKAEETVLMEMLKNKAPMIRNGANKDQALLGIHDMFKEGEWVTVFGESLYTAGYSEWSSSWYGGQPDNYNSQNCGALLIQGGMDDVFCHDKFAFFCELSGTCA